MFVIIPNKWILRNILSKFIDLGFYACKITTLYKKQKWKRGRSNEIKRETLSKEKWRSCQREGGLMLHLWLSYSYCYLKILY